MSSSTDSMDAQPKTKDEVFGVIDFKPVGHSQLKGFEKQQAARARPNKRLETVFGISNGFTSTDSSVCSKFRSEAIRKMRRAVGLDSTNYSKEDANWTNMKELAGASAHQILTQSSGRLRIVDLVRVVTLKVSMKYLFDVSEEVLQSEDSQKHLILIGQKINELWIQSKNNTQSLPEWSSTSNSGIHEALRAMCKPQEPSEADNIDPLIPEINPMNWLLPAYETMWRAVLACVVEIRFRGAPKADTWQNTLAKWLKSPTRAAFNGPPTGQGVDGFCAKDIVKEVFRLYPPTRSVYRRFTEDGEDVKADIASLHHSNEEETFGPDALCFRPERWVNMRSEQVMAGFGDDVSDTKKHSAIKTVEEDRGFLPFAMHCPAGKKFTQGFGFKKVAILAGVICEELAKAHKWDLENKDAYADLAKPLASDRAAFDDVYLIEN